MRCRRIFASAAVPPHMWRTLHIQSCAQAARRLPSLQAVGSMHSSTAAGLSPSIVCQLLATRSAALGVGEDGGAASTDTTMAASILAVGGVVGGQWAALPSLAHRLVFINTSPSCKSTFTSRASARAVDVVQMQRGVSEVPSRAHTRVETRLCNGADVDAAATVVTKQQQQLQQQQQHVYNPALKSTPAMYASASSSSTTTTATTMATTFADRHAAVSSPPSPPPPSLLRSREFVLHLVCSVSIISYGLWLVAQASRARATALHSLLRPSASWVATWLSLPYEDSKVDMQWRSYVANLPRLLALNVTVAVATCLLRRFARSRSRSRSRRSRGGKGNTSASLQLDYSRHSNSNNNSNTLCDGNNSSSSTVAAHDSWRVRRTTQRLLACFHVTVAVGFMAFVHGPFFVLPLANALVFYVALRVLRRRTSSYALYMSFVWLYNVVVLYASVHHGGFEDVAWLRYACALPATLWRGDDATATAAGTLDKGGSALPPLLWRRRMRWHMIQGMTLLRMIAYACDMWDAHQPHGVVAATRERALTRHRHTCLDCAMLRHCATNKSNSTRAGGGAVIVGSNGNSSGMHAHGGYGGSSGSSQHSSASSSGVSYSASSNESSYCASVAGASHTQHDADGSPSCGYVQCHPSNMIIVAASERDEGGIVSCCGNVRHDDSDDDADSDNHNNNSYSSSGNNDNEAAWCYKLRTECARAPAEYNLVSYYAYLFFVPLYLTGPVTSYNAFVSHMAVPCRAAAARPRALARYAARIAGLYVCLVALLHVVYVNAILADGNVLPSLTPATRASVMFFVLAFLWLKFSVIWRLARLYSLCCGMDVPEDMRRCFANVESVQGFWRDWHASFNLWIVRYMYIPMGGSKRKHLSIFPIFIFIAVWHDLDLRLLYWAGCICVAMFVELAVTAVVTRVRAAVRGEMRNIDAVAWLSRRGNYSNSSSSNVSRGGGGGGAHGGSNTRSEYVAMSVTTAASAASAAASTSSTAPPSTSSLLLPCAHTTGDVGVAATTMTAATPPPPPPGAAVMLCKAGEHHGALASSPSTRMQARTTTTTAAAATAAPLAGGVGRGMSPRGGRRSLAQWRHRITRGVARVLVCHLTPAQRERGDRLLSTLAATLAAVALIIANLIGFSARTATSTTAQPPTSTPQTVASSVTGANVAFVVCASVFLFCGCGVSCFCRRRDSVVLQQQRAYYGLTPA